MKLKVVTLTTRASHPGLSMLKLSLEKFGYDYYVIEQNAGGKNVFGSQMPLVYDWCKDQSEGYTHILYTDAWDTFFVAPLSEIEEKYNQDLCFFGSSEKVCWPNDSLAKDFPADSQATEWQYLNGGSWIADINYFRWTYERAKPNGMNDQEWLIRRYLEARSEERPLALDHTCQIFQPLAFESPFPPSLPGADFAFNYLEGRMTNLKTGTKPIILHGNAQVSMERAYKLLLRC